MNSIPEEYTFELIRLTDLKIEPCKACYRCLQPDNDCPIKDNFNFVMSKIKEADTLIIGVPVYILGPHGYYKMLTDRLVGRRIMQAGPLKLENIESTPWALIPPKGDC